MSKGIILPTEIKMVVTHVKPDAFALFSLAVNDFQKMFFEKYFPDTSVCAPAQLAMLRKLEAFCAKMNYPKPRRINTNVKGFYFSYVR